MHQTHLPERWIERVCACLEIPLNHEILRFFQAWERSEGGAATWNPLNTTNHVHSRANGEWQGGDFNSAEVADFFHPWQGVLATVDTLEQSIFNNLVIALRKAKSNGSTAEEIVEGHESVIRTWGTNPQTMLDVLVSIS